MTAVSGRSLLGRAVRWQGIRIGAVEDVFLDVRRRRALGLEVLCEDGGRRFLPLAAFGFGRNGLELSSPLVLVDGSALSFYRTRARSLTELAGVLVRHDGDEPATLADVLVRPEGELEALVVRDAGGSHLVPADSAELERATPSSG